MTGRAIKADLILARAQEVARAAAERSQVEIRDAEHPQQFSAADALMRAIWRTDVPPVSPQMMRAITHSGGSVAVAYDAAGTLVGVTVAFVGQREDGVLLHSHVAAVAPRVQGRGVGFALKQHQRAWALRRGIEVITWTYDPLVRRNAVFNLRKLRAEIVAFEPDFYGPVQDGINGRDATDRFVVHWRLTGRSDGAIPSETPARTLESDAAGAPVRRPLTGAAPSSVAIQSPTDIEALRSSAPEVATAWRSAFRAAVLEAGAAGLEVRTVDRAGWYLLDRGDRA